MIPYKRGYRPPPLYKWSAKRKNPVVNVGGKLVRRALIMQVVPGIVDAMRAFHVNTYVQGVKHYRAQGEFQPEDEVVQLVDGSPVRPVRNVSLGGQIVLAENPAGNARVLQAAQTAFVEWTTRAQIWRDKGRYLAGMRIHVDGREISPGELARLTGAFDQIVISNHALHAGKMEAAWDQFAGYSVWKKMMAEGWGNRVSMRFQIGGHPVYRTASGRPSRIPQLVISRLGEFTSRGPNRRIL